MELQHFINENKDYIHQFKEHKLFVRKYSQKGLCIVKGYYNRDYDYENNPWIKYCRGAVIDIKNHKVVCIPPEKAKTSNIIDLNRSGKIVFVPKEKLHRVKNIDEVINNYDENNEYQPLIDGTMVNMFYHNDEWIISTRSNIGAKNKWDGKTPFHELFKDVNGDTWFNQLDTKNCYSFTLQHKDNRIITPVYKNIIYLNEVYSLKDGNIIKLVREELPEIEGIETIQLLEKNDVYLYLERDNIFSIKGFTIKKDSLRIKWMNPNYEYVEELKVNNNNKFFSYLELRRTFKLSEYIKFFPEEQYLFDDYRTKYTMIKNELLNSYVSLKITKEKEWSDIRYEMKPLIKELHHEYLNGKGKINSQYVTSYMDRLPIGKIYFIYNRIF